MEIPDYRLLSRCGHGAFGEVWIAEDSAGRRVALKIIDSSARSRKELDGLRACARLADSPHLIRFFHIGAAGSTLYYTMELADDLNDGTGRYLPATLDNLLERRGRFPAEEVCRFGLQLLDGL